MLWIQGRDTQVKKEFMLFWLSKMFYFFGIVIFKLLLLSTLWPLIRA